MITSRRATGRGVGLAFGLLSVLAVLSSPGGSLSADSNEAPPASALVSLQGRISAGNAHTCIVTAAGAAKCTGQNTYGQLGDGTTTSTTGLVQVSGLTSGVASISAGDTSTCALLTSGAVKCWGDNSQGQLGNGTLVSSTTPVQVTGLTTGVSQISVGYQFACAISSTNNVKCWGDSTYQQTGRNSTSDVTTPLNVCSDDYCTAAIGPIASVSAGRWHACAVSTSGAAMCWGHNNYGKLGNGSMVDSGRAVTPTGLGSGVSMISAGAHHTCALMTAGGVKCWGWGAQGQIGNGAVSDVNTPTNTSSLGGTVLALSSGYHFACVLMSGPAVKCWGFNSKGQIGDGSTTNRSTPVVATVAVSGVQALTSGTNHTCVVDGDGSVKCWGQNLDGQLGDGTNTDSTAAVTMAGASAVGATTTSTASSTTSTTTIAPATTSATTVPVTTAPATSLPASTVATTPSTNQPTSTVPSTSPVAQVATTTQATSASTSTALAPATNTIAAPSTSTTVMTRSASPPVSLDSKAVPTSTTEPAVSVTPHVPDEATIEGQTGAMVDGVKVEAEVSVSGTSVRVSTAGATVTVDASLAGAAVRDDGSLIVTPSTSLPVSLQGLAPHSPVGAWLMSTPLELVTGVTTAQGTLKTDITLPATARPGEHHLVLRATTLHGHDVVVSVPVTVTDGGRHTSRNPWLIFAIVLSSLLALAVPVSLRARSAHGAG